MGNIMSDESGRLATGQVDFTLAVVSKEQAVPSKEEILSNLPDVSSDTFRRVKKLWAP